MLVNSSWLARTTRTASDKRKATAASSTQSSATTWVEVLEIPLIAQLEVVQGPIDVLGLLYALAR